jgi:hypothetical protein
MTANIGFVALHRKIRANWIYPCDRTFTKYEAWLDLIMYVNFEEGVLKVSEKPIKLQAGEMVYSLRYLAKRWGWSKNKVNNFLNILSEEKMIKQGRMKGHNLSLLTICNYETYNPFQDNLGTDIRTPKGHPRDTRGTNKNKKEQEKTIYINSIRAVIEQFPNHMSKDVLRYSRMFKTEKQKSKDDDKLPITSLIKINNNMNELYEIFMCKSYRDGKLINCTNAQFEKALQKVITSNTIDLPLRGNGYLKVVLVGDINRAVNGFKEQKEDKTIGFDEYDWSKEELK